MQAALVKFPLSLTLMFLPTFLKQSLCIISTATLLNCLTSKLPLRNQSTLLLDGWSSKTVQSHHADVHCMHERQGL